MKNAINWFEIPVTDFYRAKTFYEQILDIKMHEVTMHGEQMAFFEADQSAVGGAIVKGDSCEPCTKGSKIYGLAALAQIQHKHSKCIYRSIKSISYLL